MTSALTLAEWGRGKLLGGHSQLIVPTRVGGEGENSTRTSHQRRHEMTDPHTCVTVMARYRKADEFNALQKQDLRAAVKTEIGSDEKTAGKKEKDNKV